MTVLAFSPPGFPLTDSRGYVSRDWQLFLAGLYERVGGTVSQTIPEVASDVAAIAVDVAAAVDAADAAVIAADAATDAVTALTAALLAMRLPVGSIHVSVSPTDPATTLGYGTWAAFGTGRVIVGVDVGDADFDTVEETGGSKTATI